MLDNGVSFDGFNLVRCLYEKLYEVRYLYQYPDAVEIFSAQLGIILGTHRLRLIPLSQVNQDLGLAGQVRNGDGFDFFGRS
jgi:hypothetical protein